MGQICRNELQENPLSEFMFSEHVGSSKDSQRLMGNHQVHTSPFWLQVCLDMERHGNVSFRLLGQHSGILSMFFLVVFATLQGRGVRQEMLCVLVSGWVLLGEGTREGAGGLHGKTTPLQKVPVVTNKFFHAYNFKRLIKRETFHTKCMRGLLSSCCLRHWESSFQGSL